MSELKGMKMELLDKIQAALAEEDQVVGNPVEMNIARFANVEALAVRIVAGDLFMGTEVKTREGTPERPTGTVTFVCKNGVMFDGASKEMFRDIVALSDSVRVTIGDDGVLRIYCFIDNMCE